MTLTIESALRKDLRREGNPTFQHRHFAAIAAVVRGLDVTDSARHKTAKAFANALQYTNRNFDPDRFINACHGETQS